MVRLALLVLVLILTLSYPATAQEPYVVPRLEGPVELDGLSDEPAWEAVEPVTLVMQTPTFRGEPTARTEMRIAHDDSYIYVSARCFDDPDGVRSASFKRDFFTPASDNVFVLLDTFDDNENGLAFITFPTGNRSDAAIFNDAEGEFPFNVDWNTFWTVEVVQNGEGWFAEMRIPFSSLRFQGEDGRVEMGLMLQRYIARKSEVVGYPAIERKYGPWSWAKPSLAQTIVFEGLQSTRPLYVAPYALGGMGRYAELNGDASAYETARERVGEAGLDLKVGLARNLTLDLTANPDFAQVEADDEQVNLTRFSLFFPEKRKFFQERASTFAFRFGEEDRLFYSRRIGLREGEAVRILGGARLVGRLGGWDVGLIDMQTAREAGLPSENLGVLRLRRRVFNPYSYVGAMTTSRLGENGSYNVAYGLDGTFRLFGDDYLALNWAQTFDDRTAGGVLEAAHVRAHWERRAQVGPGYEASFARAGTAYTPGLGFQLRRDYTRLGDRLFYGWMPEEGSRLFQHEVSLYGHIFLRNADGTVESAAVGPGWSGRTRPGAEFDVRLLRRTERLREAFALPEGVAVPAGAYTFHQLEATYSMPSGARRTATFDVVTGTFYDGRRFAVGVEPAWNASQHLDLSGTYRFERVVFPERDRRFSAHVGGVRVEASLNTELSGAIFVQYNSAADAVSANVRLRYNPREGNDLYLVYDHGLNTDRRRLAPRLPMTARRTVLVKYTYTFNFGI